MLLSIAIPNWNYGHYLRQCLDSVVQLAGDDIEILVSDNASTDDSWKIIESYRDKRIRKWRQDVNIGLGRNWQFLLDRARGQYFKMVLADDYIYPGFLETVRPLLTTGKNSPVAAICWPADKIDRVGVVRQPCQTNTSTPLVHSATDLVAVRQALAHSMPTLSLVCTEIARRTGGFRPLTSMRLDAIMMARVMTSSMRCITIVVNQPLCAERVHSANMRFKYNHFANYWGEIRLARIFRSSAKSTRDKTWIMAWHRDVAAGAFLSALLQGISGEIVDSSRNLRMILRAGLVADVVSGLAPHVIRKILRHLPFEAL